MRFLALIMLITGCATTNVQREIQASLDASVEADRRKDLDARMALFTPDMTLETLSGEVRTREQLASGIAGFHQSTVAIGPATRDHRTHRGARRRGYGLHESTSRPHDLRRPGSAGRARQQYRHREKWIKTSAGWKVRHVEETEQGPVTLAGKPVPIDTRRFEESTLNTAGYSLLARGRNEDAIEAFRMNTEAYPRSVNVWDSLAEAYAAVKQNDKAVEFYRKVRTSASTPVRPAPDRFVAEMDSFLARLWATTPQSN